MKRAFFQEFEGRGEISPLQWVESGGLGSARGMGQIAEGAHVHVALGALLLPAI